MKIATWAALVLVVTGLLLFLFDGGRDSNLSLSTSPEPVDQGAGLDAPAPRLEVDRAASTAEPDVAAAPISQEAPVQPAAEQPKLATMRGRFLLPDGNPAAGVKVKLWGFQANSDLVRKHGLPTDWENKEGETDAEGRFEFFFDPPQAYQMLVDAKLAGYAEASWRWGPLPTGESTDLGTITLAAGGRIEGRLMDKAGQPLHGEWYVQAESSYRMSGSGGDGTRVPATLDPSTGAFTCIDVPPGTAELRANSRESGWIFGPSVEVRAGETAHANITYEGPDERSLITVLVFSEPIDVASNDLESVLLYGGPGEPRRGEHWGANSFGFIGLDSSSEYRIEIRDPRIVPFSQGGLRPGNSYNAMLTGSSAVALEVVDEASGDAVHGYRLTVRYRNARFWPNEFEIRERGAREPEHGLYRGIVPGDISLIVEGDGSKFAIVDLDAVGSNETRSAVARLSSGSTLEGKVIQAGGGVVAGASVEIEPTLDPSTKAEPFELARQRNELREREELCKETVTDATGAFSFSGLTPGWFEVTTRQGEFVKASKVVHVPLADQQPVILELPNPGFIVGRLTGFSERAVSNLVVRVERVAKRGEPEVDFERYYRMRDEAERCPKLDTEGRFRLGPLEAGAYQVYLRGPGGEVPRGSWGSANLDGIEVRLAKVDVRAGEESSLEKDLSAKNPGYVVVAAQRDEGGLHPAAGIVVTVGMIQEEPRFRLFASREPEQTGETGGQTDANGKLVLGPIFAGEWEVRAATVDQSWFLKPPQRVKIPPAGEVAIELRVQVFEHELEVLDDETGDPCKRKPFMVELGDGYSMGFGTDDRGRLKLRLGPGKYALWEHVEFDFRNPEALMKPRQEPKRYEFEWTAAGPVPPTLRVTAEPKK